jgi:hypothetical protein
LMTLEEGGYDGGRDLDSAFGLLIYLLYHAWKVAILTFFVFGKHWAFDVVARAMAMVMVFFFWARCIASTAQHVRSMARRERRSYFVIHILESTYITCWLHDSVNLAIARVAVE